MAEEQKLQTDILNDLRSYQKYMVCFKVTSPSDNGIPDVFFTTVITGPVFIEVKRPGEKPSPLQYEKIRKLNECGCKAFWTDSWPGWVEIKHKLKLSH